MCNVARHELVAAQASDDRRQRAEGRVTSLDLTGLAAPEGGEALYRFLELIGSPLTRLRLNLNFYEDLGSDRLMRSCPNLEALVINDIEIDSVAFVESYRANKPRISELDCRFDSLDCILKELRDNTTQLARILKRLVYLSYHDTDFDNLVPMLQENKVLEYVEITVRPEVYRRYAAGMKRCHFVSLPVVREPFPLRCRLAFLSIFGPSWHRSDRDVKRAKSELGLVSGSPVLASFPVDQHVMSIIFGFAAERARRRVYFSARDVPTRRF